MKISIITISLNSHRFIAQTIESVLAQTYDQLEYVIVDGASTDGTVDIVKHYAGKDTRIRWVSEQDKGISDAMNKGVLMASGDVIAHLHSDEFYLDNQVLADVAMKFKHEPEKSWLTAGFHFVNETGNFMKEIKVRNYSYKRLIHSNIILHPATFIRREVFNALGGFDLSLHYCMDYHLWLRLGAIGDPAIITRALAGFRVHSGSRSIADARSAYEEEYRVRMCYLRSQRMSRFPYLLEYVLKKRLNKHFIQGLLKLADQAGSNPIPR